VSWRDKITNKSTRARTGQEDNGEHHQEEKTAVTRRCAAHGQG